MQRGELVAAGRTSDVYRFGPGAVVKIPRPDVPDRWAHLEAEFTAALASVSVPAPRVLDVTEFDGRAAIVFEHIEGPTMWQLMLDAPSRIGDLSALLAVCHQQVFAAGPPVGVDGLVERLLAKIGAVEQVEEHDRAEAARLVGELPRGAALLHGDLHPGNVLMTDDGPVAIDWFDASIGHPVADVIRSSLLMRPSCESHEPSHLPGADSGHLAAAHEAYLDAMSAVLDDVSTEHLRRWEAVVALSRLSEGPQPDGPALIDLWRRRDQRDGALFGVLSRR